MPPFEFQLDDRLQKDGKNDFRAIDQMDDMLHQIGGVPKPPEPRPRDKVFKSIEAYQHEHNLKVDGNVDTDPEDPDDRRKEGHGPTAANVKADLHEKRLAAKGQKPPAPSIILPLTAGVGIGQPNKAEDVHKARRAMALLGTYPRSKALAAGQADETDFAAIGKATAEAAKAQAAQAANWPATVNPEDDPDLLPALKKFQKQQGLKTDGVMLPDRETQTKAGRLLSAEIAAEIGDDFYTPQPFQPKPNPTIARNHPDLPTRMSVPFGSGMGLNEDDTGHRLATAHAREIKADDPDTRSGSSGADSLTGAEDNDRSQGTRTRVRDSNPEASTDISDDKRSRQSSPGNTKPEDDEAAMAIEVKKFASNITLDERFEELTGLDLSIWRGTILPVGKTHDGKRVLAWPAPFVELGKALILPGHAYEGGTYTVDDVTGFTSSMATGGLAKTRPQNSVGSGGRTPKNLPANLRRAQEQGYEPDRFFRGERSGQLPDEYAPGTFFSRDQEYADAFAQKGKVGKAREFRLRFRNPMSLSSKITFRHLGNILSAIERIDGREAAEQFASRLPFFEGQPSLDALKAASLLRATEGVSNGAMLIQVAKMSYPGLGYFRYLHEAGFNAIDTGRDVIMLGKKGIRLNDAEFDPDKIDSFDIHSSVEPTSGFG